MVRLRESGGFIKPLIIIGILACVLVYAIAFGLFGSFPKLSFAANQQSSDAELKDLEAISNTSLGPNGLELLDQSGLRASANVDWSIIYGATEFERSQVAAAIMEASSLYGVNADLLRAIIMTESVFDDKAVSKKGARGLMQLMPGTALEVGVSNVHDIRENILGGASYFSGLLEDFDGDVRLALAAYNAGARTIHNANRQIPVDILPYVNRVLSYYRVFSGIVS